MVTGAGGRRGNGELLFNGISVQTSKEEEINSV